MLNIGPNFKFNYVVVQPTELCNLDCRYCYLPNRKSSRKMDVCVAEKLANDIEEIGSEVQLIWHGGEPLTAGLKHMKKLISPFSTSILRDLAIQCIQTNAVLIDEGWIEFFTEHNINVGVSIDGDRYHNRDRVFWGGRESFYKAVRGIELLQKNNIKFSVISVVGKKNLTNANDIYRYLSGLGAGMLGFNVEETEGINREGVQGREGVKKFWYELVSSWIENPVVPIRELNYIAPILCLAANRNEAIFNNKIIDIFPSISVEGDVVLLSPEFLNAKSKEYGDFFVGNLMGKSLKSIVEDYGQVEYVGDFLKGVSNCKDECEYFPFCGGGQASNKFFENDDLKSTQTNYCLNTVQSLVDAVLQSSRGEWQ